MPVADSPVCVVIGLVVWSALLWSERVTSGVGFFLLRPSFNFSPPGDKSRSCVHPDLMRDSGVLDALYRPLPPLQCRAHEWVYTHQGGLHYNKTALRALNVTPDSVTCTYAAIERVSDFKSKLADEKPLLYSGMLVPHDFFRVTCRGTTEGQSRFNIFTSQPSYVNYHAHVAYDEVAVAKLAPSSGNGGLQLDVIMIGMDSVSQVAWQRMLPRTYAYMTSVLGSVLLKSYNIVGDGTPQALTPMLTGRNELELPTVLKRVRTSDTVDVYPMIWKQFKAAGYLTMMGEDHPGIGTYQLRMRGFEHQPTDHYMRTFYLKLENALARERELCLGARPRHQVALAYLRDFVFAYPNLRKFAFLFYNELSHDDPSRLQYADGDILRLLRELHDGGALNRTALLLFSDHGTRFSKFRATSQGLLEERMPFVSVTLPPWFPRRHPDKWRHLQENSNVLTTPYDIHELLVDVVASRERAPAAMGLLPRGISPLAAITRDRSCEDAGVDMHWCACLAWEPVPVADPKIQTVASGLVDYINTLVATEADACAELRLSHIVNASSFKPNSRLLSFSKTKDVDGLIPEFHNRPDVVRIDYRVTVSTEPGSGLFEATLTLLKGQLDQVDASRISRVNKYGDAPHCIMDTREDLRKYCYCKDLLK
ncbi:PREDICTED: uncharacterized protein LOC106812834 [Priapulus caudatus]|uniref:Uncharacterized protein LOC106812834 n=1 Tax=Priapulus caudatus TaxID=37621 RepID=A0ABM1EJD1_PRICU|nr:PREDICTED: uncharacterized protein LOC106812834 [Priapulus caudatus]